MNPTSFRSRLLGRERLIGTILSIPSPALAEMCADAGFDWLFVDMEHGALDLHDVEHIAQAVNGRAACVVRVPINDRMWIGKVLDLGVPGIIVPQVNSADQAQRAVSAAKYPPQGERGVGTWRASRYGVELNDYLERANNETAIIAQIEHVDAVKNLNAIVNVAGVDALLIGPFDLSGSFGKPGRIADDDVQAAITHVRDTALARKMPISIYCPTFEMAQRAQTEGYSLMLVSSDTTMFSRAARNLLQDLHA